MKFKTREETLKTLSNDMDVSQRLVKTHDKGYEVGFNCAVNSVFDSFKERLDFYKIYRDNLDGLYETQYEIYRKFMDYVTPKMQIDNVYKQIKVLHAYYNDWLFDYCFGDVVNGI